MQRELQPEKYRNISGDVFVVVSVKQLGIINTLSVVAAGDPPGVPVAERIVGDHAMDGGANSCVERDGTVEEAGRA